MDSSVDFCLFRAAFWDIYKDDLQGLGIYDGRSMKLSPAPVSQELQDRFMKTVFGFKNGELIAPAFHGTNHQNFASIFQHGLLIPGIGNKLRVVHGKAHGRGIYTANLNAAWLSKRFCSVPKLLVCAVIQSGMVKFVGDAQVVFNPAHVVPLFVASSKSFSLLENLGSADVAPTAISVRDVLTRARMLKLCKIHALIKAGYPAIFLKEIGHAAAALKYAGCSASVLATLGYPLPTLKQVGCTATSLQRAGYKAAELRTSGFPASALVEAGYTIAELKEGSYTVADLQEAGCTHADVLKAGAGYKAAELRKSGFSASALLQAGYTIAELKEGNYIVADLQEAGCAHAAVLRAGYSAFALKEAGYKAARLKKAGYSAASLKEAGYADTDVVSLDYPVVALRCAGYPPAVLRSIGKADADILSGGYAATVLKEAGYAASAMKYAGYRLTALKEAGYESTALKEAGYTASALKTAGYSETYVTNPGYPSGSCLKRASMKAGCVRASCHGLFWCMVALVMILQFLHVAKTWKAACEAPAGDFCNASRNGVGVSGFQFVTR